MIDRIVNTSVDEAEKEAIAEVTLRPKDFTSYIGQEKLKQNLKLAITAAKKRNEPARIRTSHFCTQNYSNIAKKTHSENSKRYS